MRSKLTTEQFIQKAQAVHGLGKYDYSEAVYNSAKEKIKIICPIHGVFEQKAISHTIGHGCKWCGGTGGLTTALFAQKAEAKHGHRYDYSRVEYSHTSANVCIICPTHGAFSQTPHDHLAGNGCQKCGVESFAKKQTYTQGEFLSRARAVHGNRYDYSQVKYLHTDKKVTIICAKHGTFNQTPTSHILAAQGCPACGRERTIDAHKLDWITRATGRTPTLYFLRIFAEGEEFYKIGITYLTIKKRYSGPSDMGGYSYEILAQHTSTDAARIWEWERSILETFAHLRYRPKTRFGGETECFASCEEILSIFPL